MAKLVLYSDQFIEENKKVDKELLNLFNKSNPSIAYIPSESSLTRKYFDEKVEYYKALGIENLQYFDIDKEYEASRIVDMFKCDAIQLSGGNTFYFLYLLRKRGLIRSLKSFVKNGGILIGISAGSILMTRNINTAGLGEDADENIIGIKNKAALNIVDFEFMPHWKGSTKKLNLLKKYAEAKKTTVYACKDGDGIIIDGENIKLIGDILKIN